MLKQKIKTAIKIFKLKGFSGIIFAIKDKVNYKQIQSKLKPTLKMKRAWNFRHDFYLNPLAFGVDEKTYNAQKSYSFSRNIKFSILVPLYNTPETFLKEMIGSVLFQTYSNWELCLADGSDAEHSYVQEICERIAKDDIRIKYRKLEKNEGISANTNKCLEMANGDYICLFDHDDLLHPSALFETMKAICEKDADFVYTDEAVFKSPNLHEITFTNFKPDFAPDYLNGNNYITHFVSFSKDLKALVGNFDSDCDGAQDYDMILRLTEKAKTIAHVTKCLYYWRASPTSTASGASAKSYTTEAGKRALQKHFARLSVEAEVLDAELPNTYRIKYPINGEPLVSILIPNYEHWQTLKKCIDSIINLSTYTNYEIIVIENNSKQKETFDYYESLKDNPKIKVVEWQGIFNYSAINNFGFEYAKGDYVLLLNNDIEVITPEWLEEMLMFAQRSDVGAVGAMLYYPSNKIQHAGVVVGINGSAGHSHKAFDRGSYGFAGRLAIVQNYSAVTAACVMVPSKVYKELNGLDEDFIVAFNDVDFCLRIRKAGYKIVWTPFAELYHYESESRGYEDTPEKIQRFENERKMLQKRWPDYFTGCDPYYNPNLISDRENFMVVKGVFST